MHTNGEEEAMQTVVVIGGMMAALYWFGPIGPAAVCGSLIVYWWYASRDPQAAYRLALIERMEQEGAIRSLDPRYAGRWRQGVVPAASAPAGCARSRLS